MHKKLERAIQPEEIVMPVVVAEERIASKSVPPLASSDPLMDGLFSRLLNMISGLRLLKTLGYCMSCCFG